RPPGARWAAFVRRIFGKSQFPGVYGSWTECPVPVHSRFEASRFGMNSTVRDLASKTGVMLRLITLIGAERKPIIETGGFRFCPRADLQGGTRDRQSWVDCGRSAPVAHGSAIPKF